jgi:hypothetical protein
MISSIRKLSAGALAIAAAIAATYSDDADARPVLTPATVARTGDCSDGDLNINSGTTTLTRPMHYRDVTISGTAKLEIGRFSPLLVCGTLDLTNAPANAIIATPNAGGNASGVTGGTLTNNSTAGHNATPGNAGNGQNGGSTTGSNGNASVLTAMVVGGLGAAGGAGGTGASGAGGTAGSVTLSTGYQPVAFADWRTYTLQGGLAANAGQGGDGTQGGGAGTGGPGGYDLTISADKISVDTTNTAAGAISALGGRGGDGGVPAGGNRGGGGAGGGGGGGRVRIFYNTLSGTKAAVIVCTGGAGGDGGAGTGTGTAGGGGNGGNGGDIWVFNTRAGTATHTAGSAGSAASGTTGGAGGACSGTL